MANEDQAGDRLKPDQRAGVGEGVGQSRPHARHGVGVPRLRLLGKLAGQWVRSEPQSRPRRIFAIQTGQGCHGAARSGAVGIFGIADASASTTAGDQVSSHSRNALARVCGLPSAAASESSQASRLIKACRIDHSANRSPSASAAINAGSAAVAQLSECDRGLAADGRGFVLQERFEARPRRGVAPDSRALRGLEADFRIGVEQRLANGQARVGSVQPIQRPERVEPSRCHVGCLQPRGKSRKLALTFPDQRPLRRQVGRSARGDRARREVSSNRRPPDEALGSFGEFRRR